MHFIVFVSYRIPFMTGACQSLISGCEKKLIFVYFRRKQQFETCINNNLMKFLITCLPLSYIVPISFNKFKNTPGFIILQKLPTLQDCFICMHSTICRFQKFQIFLTLKKLNIYLKVQFSLYIILKYFLVLHCILSCLLSGYASIHKQILISYLIIYWLFSCALDKNNAILKL